MKIGYARVSTEQQSLPRQVERLEEEGCERIYKAKISGGASRRPTIEKVFEVLREGDMLVVTRLDRLGRNLQGLIEWSNTLDEMGVDLMAINENIDTSSAMGELFFHIMAAFAQFDRRRKKERTMEGIEQARSEGRSGGRPFKITKDDLPILSRLIQDPDVAVSQICDRFDICKATLYSHVGPDGTIRSALRSENGAGPEAPPRGKQASENDDDPSATNNGKKPTEG